MTPRYTGRGETGLAGGQAEHLTGYGDRHAPAQDLIEDVPAGGGGS